MFKRVLGVRTRRFYGCELANLVDLMNLRKALQKRASFVGGSASPFIDKDDGFTGERERVRMFLSLVAHVDEGSDDGRRPQYC